VVDAAADGVRLAQMAIAFDSSRMLTLAFRSWCWRWSTCCGGGGGGGGGGPGGGRPWTRRRARARDRRAPVGPLDPARQPLRPQLFTAGTIVEQMHSPLARLLLSLTGAKP